VPGTIPIAVVETPEFLSAILMTEEERTVLERFPFQWNHCVVIPRESGESSTPQRLGLLDRPLSRGMTAER
jgi:hypothetical protein